MCASSVVGSVEERRWKVGTENGRWEMEDGGWRMEDGGWSMEDRRWRMEDRGWRMEDGGRKTGRASWKMAD